MSAGIDKEFVQDFYQRMTDKELLQTLNGNLRGLTQEAREVISEEVQRRKLDFDVSSIPAAQEEDDNYKVYDPNGCPVEEAERIWIERSFLSLLTLFGEENTLTRQVLLPVTKDFPIKYDGSERAAFETLKVVARQMEVPIDKIKLDFFDKQLQYITDGSPGGFYYGKGENDKFEISVVRTLLNEPEDMVAVLAHETAHIKLLGEDRITENNEPLTDLTTIFFGLGVFNANAAFKTFADNKYWGWSQSGYLSQMAWGYALALFAYVRQEETPAWASHLCKNVKGDFIQGQNFIANNEEVVFQQ